MNDTKSAPFAYMVKAKKKKQNKKKTKKKSMYPPKVVKKPPVLTNYAKFADHFFIWTTRNGNLKSYSKLCKICSIHQPTQ